MSRTGMAGVFSLLLVLSVVMGAYSSISMPSVIGFSESDLREPGIFTAPASPTPPANIAGDITSRPSISVRILIGQVFAEYGGSVRINVTNDDTRSFFLQELEFAWVGTGLSSAMDVNRRIEPRETCDIKALAIEGPPQSGLQEYRLGVRLLQFQNGQWHRTLSGGDYWLSFSEQTIDVSGLSDASENPISYNPRAYYMKTNELVDFSSESVADALASAAPDIAASDYDMGAVCAIFDWLVTNINYTEDPNGTDVWYSPDETLAMMAGDCEDYAMLLAAMVNLAGGTSRMYLTTDHAFAAVYVGESPGDLDRATADIRAYYRTPVSTHSFRDETGYWMVADPLGSFYMGGIAVGQVPTVQDGDYWNAAFPDSGTLYSIDVTGVSRDIPLWLDPVFWMGMIAVFGAMALGFAILAILGKAPARVACFNCAGDIGENIYVCPHCQTAYHRECAFGGAYCRNCGNAVSYPPPPPEHG